MRLPTYLIVATAALAMAAGCASQRQAAAAYNPSKRHTVSFVRPRACPDETLVTIVVDSIEVRLADHKDLLLLKVPEGVHTFIQYIGSYEVKRWPHVEIVRETYYSLGCFRESGPQEKFPIR